MSSDTTECLTATDEQWIGFGCDPTNMDERVTAFYRHPVWMLNGLFIEQHPQSLENRRVFTDWITQQAPGRVADFGGGFGSLARFIGQALPAAQVEVVDPHPHAAAIELAATTPNVRFVPELTGIYDMLIATDVFEHVPDPIGLAAETAAHLRLGGMYLIANCFQPVILCHLPHLFHLHYGWDHAIARLGLRPGGGLEWATGAHMSVWLILMCRGRGRSLHARDDFIPGLKKFREEKQGLGSCWCRFFVSQT